MVILKFPGVTRKGICHISNTAGDGRMVTVVQPILEKIIPSFRIISALG